MTTARAVLLLCLCSSMMTTSVQGFAIPATIAPQRAATALGATATATVATKPKRKSRAKGVAKAKTTTTTTRAAAKKKSTTRRKSKAKTKKAAAKKTTARRGRPKGKAAPKPKNPLTSGTIAVDMDDSVAALHTKTRTKSEEQFYQSLLKFDDVDVMYNPDITSFQELQRSTGSEIVDDSLQLQIDHALEQPNTFLDAHVQDASQMEKIAMSSIPQQLPKPVLAALGETGGVNNNDGSVGTSVMSEGAATPTISENVLPDKRYQRLTSEQEIQLGKMIQLGAKIHSIRTKYNDQNPTQEITRQEWAQLAGMSVKELRRTVANYRNAKQYLVQANVGLVHAVVKQQYSSRSHKHSSYEEIVQEGSLGLIRAAELFDPTKGLRFSTYATIWIKGQLSNTTPKANSGLIKIPLREQTKWNKIQRAQQSLQEDPDTPPTIEAIACHSGLRVSDVASTLRKMGQMRRPLSLDYEYESKSRGGERSAGTSESTLQVPSHFIDDIDLQERTQMQADLVAALASNLDAREARLMRLRYGLGDGQMRSLSECADAMGLSQTRVQQLAKQCLSKLRQAEEAESLQEYLLTIA